jgi:ketosteroid isomerase-like protein
VGAFGVITMAATVLKAGERTPAGTVVRNFWTERLIDGEAAIRRYVDPSIIYRTPSGHGHPIAYIGLDEVVRAIRNFDVNVEFLSFEIQDLIVDAEKVALRWYSMLRHRGTGVTTELVSCSIITVRNGLIIEYDQYLDSESYLRLVAGEPQTSLAKTAVRSALAQVAHWTPFAGNEPDVSASKRGQSEALVRKFWARRLEAGGAALLEMACDDCELTLVGDRTMVPFARTHRGIEDCKALIDQIDREFQFLSFEIRDIVAEGDHVGVQWNAMIRHHGTGAKGMIEVLDHLVLREGKIRFFTGFFDTAAAARWIAG